MEVVSAPLRVGNWNQVCTTSVGWLGVHKPTGSTCHMGSIGFRPSSPYRKPTRPPCTSICATHASLSAHGARVTTGRICTHEHTAIAVRSGARAHDHHRRQAAARIVGPGPASRRAPLLGGRATTYSACRGRRVVTCPPAGCAADTSRRRTRMGGPGTARVVAGGPPVCAYMTDSGAGRATGGRQRPRLLARPVVAF